MIIKAVSTENGHEVLNLIKNLKLLLENATESGLKFLLFFKVLQYILLI